MAAALLVLVTTSAQADKKTTVGNTLPSAPPATASLNFAIAISKFVMLRVGNPDASQSDVNFTVGINPVVAGVPGNSVAYTGTIAPGFATSVATTNPVSAAGALTVQAFTNVAGTNITCSMAALAGATAFAPIATAAGIPGRADIKVASVGVPHPGADLSACTGAVTAAVTTLSTLSGSYTYSTAYVPTNLSYGTFGNQVTYTITAP